MRLVDEQLHEAHGEQDDPRELPGEDHDVVPRGLVQVVRAEARHHGQGLDAQRPRQNQARPTDRGGAYAVVALCHAAT